MHNKISTLWVKKILLILCILIGISQSFGVAFGCDNAKCSIADGPSEAVTTYLTDLSKIITNVSREARSAENKSASLGKIKSQTLRITNATAGFSGYFSSFDYYVAYPITHDVPYQVERDHKILLNQNKRLLNTIKRVLQSGGGDVQIEKACDGIQSGNCDFNNQSAQDILASLLKNHKKIIYFYQLNVLGKSQNFKDELTFVDDNFESDIQKHYGPDSIKECSDCEGGFQSRITESISNIGKLNEESEGAVNKWKYAWAVLTGDKTSAQEFLKRGDRKDFYKESLGLGEEDVLKRYLGETGAGAKTSEIALENLKRYNESNSGSLINNGNLNTSNPLENTARNTFSDIKNQINSFDESVLQNYETGDKQSLPTNLLKTTQTQIEITEGIRDAIAELYNTQESINITQDNSVENLQAKMIQMHIHLSESINTLEKITQVSEKVCNSQGKGLGKCKYR